MTTETLQGYIVDLACLRRYPHAELLDRARRHTVECAMMGHCVESGYALVGNQAELFLLDTGATPLVLAALKRTALREGVALQSRRELQDGEMKTVGVELL